MFENPLSPLQNARMLDDHCCENLYARQFNTALSQFHVVLRKGQFFRMIRKVLRRSCFLLDWNTIKSDLQSCGSYYSGLKVVRIDAIIGSEGKTSDFDLHFHPMSESSRERWVNMAIAYLARTALPPVQLIESGGNYFIRDGHHRVSVSRAFGQVSTDAEVITWNATPPLPWEANSVPGATFTFRPVDLST